MLKKPKKAKKEIGYMPEGVPLYTDLTVKEFVTYLAEIKQVDKKTKKEKVEKIIEQTGLKDVEKKEINHKHDETPIEEEIKQEIEGKTTSVVEIKDESEDGDTVSLDDDDNLFDLIDSMYQEN